MSMGEFHKGMLVDGITTEGDVKLKVLGFHGMDGVIVEVVRTFNGDDVCHEKGEVFVTNQINLTPSAPGGWSAWEDARTGHPLTPNDGVNIFGVAKTAAEDALEVTFYMGDLDGKPVIQVDGTGDFRINVNDGVVFDHHTESTSLLYKAALAMYHLDVGYGSSPFAHYSLEEQHQLRRELIDAGFSGTVVDANGKPRPIACIVCDRVDGLNDAGLCDGCEEQRKDALS